MDPRARVVFGCDQRLVRERFDRVDYLELIEVVARADGEGGVERPGVGEHAEALEYDALAFGEQVVTPADRREHRRVVRQRFAPAACEQPETLVEFSRKLRRR